VSTVVDRSRVVAVRPAKCSRYRRRLSKNGCQLVAISVMNSCSQSAPVPKALDTTRTTHVPPLVASTTNSLTSGVTSAPSRPMSDAHSRSS
jgi:hypothetical protein